MTLVDRRHLDELDLVLGTETIDRLIAPMLRELAQVPVAIRDLVTAGDISAARAAAHGLRGAALGLGCAGVAELCARLETDAGDTLHDRALHLIAIAAQTAAELRDEPRSLTRVAGGRGAA